MKHICNFRCHAGLHAICGMGPADSTREEAIAAARAAGYRCQDALPASEYDEAPWRERLTRVVSDDGLYETTVDEAPAGLKLWLLLVENPSDVEGT